MSVTRLLVLLIEEPEEPSVSGSGPGSSKRRLDHRLTVDGDAEFQRLVREALWGLPPTSRTGSARASRSGGC
ncbi:hypothetical protein JCM9957A_05650 [Kineosporia succinea]|uniref:Uncharacterized protein n=1 Tax=Kineosporia succinea TaxID=84632 RepID=A0ABT9NWQ7_9ACTN|nr:hypothetical protein [Kineosporia succinea]MDP9824702.1 hypothetical protein [Kineosporia succinea]